MRRALPDLLPWTLFLAASAAVRVANPRLLWLALSFLSMAGFIAVHGLATPGVVVEREYFAVIGFSGRLAFTAAAVFLTASAVEWSGAMNGAIARYRVAILGVTSIALVAYTALAILGAELVPDWFVTSQALAWAVTASVCALGLFSATRYFRGYLRTELPLYGLVTVGAILLVQAQLSMHLGATWHGTFWLYHIQLLTGFGVILWGIVLEYSRGRAQQSIAQLSVADVVSQLRSGHTLSIVALAAALEARDGYTLGHGERVSALSILVGEELRLPLPRLRELAAGALLHDIGKIGVPDAVLHKPGALSHDDYEVIKEHAPRGDVMLAAAFTGAIECAVVRHHHERWDGSGYPDHLTGEAIPFEARIAAVADVYDALRSNRAYRPAWTRPDALAHIVQGRDTMFDPRCVDAFLAVVDRWEAQYAADHLAYDERRAVA